MTTESMLEELMDKSYYFIKNTFRKKIPAVARALDRHLPVEVNGETYTYWNELACVESAKIINDRCPDISVEVELDGNNSRIVFPDITDEQIRHMTSVVYPMIREWRS